MNQRMPLKLGPLFMVLVIGFAVWKYATWPAEDPDPGIPGKPTPSTHTSVPSIPKQLRELAPTLVLTEVQWKHLADEHGNTAVNVAKDYGANGLRALLQFGSQAVAVMRESPAEFREIAKRLDAPTAAAFLAVFAEHVKKLADTGMLIDFLDRVERLPDEAKKLGQQYPQMLLFLVLAPQEVLPALQDHRDSCLTCFAPLDLRRGPGGLKLVAKAIGEHGTVATRWVEARGLDGILLAEKFPEFIGQEPPQLPLTTFLQILNQNQEDVSWYIKRGELDKVRDAIILLARESDRWPEFREGRKPPYEGDWLKLACDDARTVRFVIDTGLEGIRVLEDLAKDSVDTGFTVPAVLYDGYKHSNDPPELWQNAWESLRSAKDRTRRQNLQILSVMAWHEGTLQQLVHERVARFRRLLQRYDYRVVTYLYAAECNPKTVEGAYLKLEQRGKDELDAMQDPGNIFIEAIPGYDVARLAFVLSKGYPPTYGEVAWGTLDAAFTAVDLATLVVGKPPAGPVVKDGIKAAIRESAEVLTKKAVGQAGEIAEKVFSTKVGRLMRSPNAIEQIAEKGLAREVSTAVTLAEKTAGARIGLRLAPYIAKEWTVNVAVGEGVTTAVQRVPADGYWGGKAIEVMEALKNLEQPVQ